MDDGHVRDSNYQKKEPEATTPMLTKITNSLAEVSAQASLRMVGAREVLDLVGSTEGQKGMSVWSGQQSAESH